MSNIKNQKLHNQKHVFIFSGANNLIPMEIALKIANKIRANERFAAYILIPMWPEGVTTSAPIQRILYWQVNFCCYLQSTLNNIIRSNFHFDNIYACCTIIGFTNASVQLIFAA